MLKKYWPLAAAIAVYLGITFVSYKMSVARNGGHLIYALDDPYIHMAYAKNMVEQGVWGVTQYHFSSATSSPLWTLLLTVYYFIFGISDIAPLILNIAAVLATLVLVFRLFLNEGLERKSNFIGLLIVLFCAPMTALTFSGMEHVLHLLFAISFIYFSAKVLGAENPKSSDSVLLFIVAPLMIMTRYEGLFMLGVTALLFLARRKYLSAVLLAAIGVLPVCIYGFISMAQDWWFFPNSVLLKGNMPASSSLGRILFFFYMSLRRLVENAHVLVLLMAAGIFLYRKLGERKLFQSPLSVMLTIFIGSSLLHLLFARTSWFFRYEAYLVGVGVFILAIAAGNYKEWLDLIGLRKLNFKSAIILLTVLIIASPFILRAGQSLIRIQQATRNIYEQQFQMARFLHKYYDGQAVGANDIGAINYYADIDCFDLWGLGTMEVARARFRGTYNSDLVSRMAGDYGVKIAIIYEEWFNVDVPGGVPEEWIPVGKWRILDNKICGDDEVTFYAVDPSEKDRLMQSLQEFSAEIPSRIIQTGAYLQFE